MTPTPGQTLTAETARLLERGDWLLVRSYENQSVPARYISGADPLVVDEAGQGRNVWGVHRFTFLGRPDASFSSGGWVRSLNKDVPRDVVTLEYHIMSDLSGDPDAVMYWRPHVTAAKEAAPVGEVWAEDDLIDLISEAIDDSLDVDWRSSDGAKSVLRRLREENLLPTPPAVET